MDDTQPGGYTCDEVVTHGDFTVRDMRGVSRAVDETWRPDDPTPWGEAADYLEQER